MNYYLALNNGVEIPQLGLGTYNMPEGPEMERAVGYALEAGYRCFDTAQMYGNEECLGRALKASGYDRESLFVTSKVNNPNQGYENAKRSFYESLDKLQTDYMDLFLIHWPGQDRRRCLDTWRALEELYGAGHARAVGVSNFHRKHLDWILEEGTVVPAVNQIERHPYLNNTELVEYCRRRNVAVQAWSPLMRGEFSSLDIDDIAAQYGKTPAQIVLRWNLQRQVMVIPKSMNRRHIWENAEVFDFEIEDVYMSKIDGLDKGYRVGTASDPEILDF